MSGPTRTCHRMLIWHDFLDSIDSDGGTRVIAVFLILLGVLCSCYAVPKSEDIIVGSFGFLLGFMKASGSNKDRREGPPMPLPSNAGAPSPIPVGPVVAAVEDVAAAIRQDETK